MKIKERLSLVLLLPTQGSLTEMVEIYDLVRELKLSDEEKKKVKYSEIGNNIQWDIKEDPDKEVNINSELYRLIMELIKKLDEQKLIPISIIELILKLKEYGKRFETNSDCS